MKKMLVLMHDDPGQEARLRAAVDLAQALHGELLCLDVAAPMLPFYATAIDALAVIDAGLADDRGAAVAAARARVAGTGVRASWVERIGDITDALHDSADQADIVILNTPCDLAYPDMRRAIGTMLVDAGKPVLAVPAGLGGIEVAGDALVLWDGSRQAGNALRASLPLLRRARSVTLLEIDDGSLLVPVDDTAIYLAARDICARVVREPAWGEKAAPLLLQRIAWLKPDYIVMGGFGRARLLEGLFGGVTERLLRESTVPLFLRH